MECIKDLDAQAIGRLAGLHLDQLMALAPQSAERIIDKMPDNYMYVGLLATLFPHAVFIHCRRDLRDVALSCWMTDFRSMSWPSQQPHIAARFEQYRRLMDHWLTVAPVAINQVDYEETVNDLEGVARRLVAMCGLEWNPACLDFHQNKRRCAPPASSRCAGRFTRARSGATRTMNPSWQSCSGAARAYRGLAPSLMTAAPLGPKERASIRDMSAAIPKCLTNFRPECPHREGFFAAPRQGNLRPIQGGIVLKGDRTNIPGARALAINRGPIRGRTGEPRSANSSRRSRHVSRSSAISGRHAGRPIKTRVAWSLHPDATIGRSAPSGFERQPRFRPRSAAGPSQPRCSGPSNRTR